MQWEVQTTRRSQGDLELTVDRIAGEHRPPGVAPATAALSWAPAEAAVTLPVKGGAVGVRARWQYGGGAIRDVEIEVDAGPEVEGRVRVLLQPLMGTGKDEAGKAIARVRWVIEANLEGALAEGTIVRRLVIDGSGRHLEDADG